MDEQDALSALGVWGEWIWRNHLETIVFAQAFGQAKTLIFRFALDSAHQQSLATRVVNCCHDLDVDSTSATFPNLISMRKAIWSEIATVWKECSENPIVNDPDVVVDVYDLEPVDGPQQIA